MSSDSRFCGRCGFTLTAAPSRAGSSTIAPSAAVHPSLVDANEEITMRAPSPPDSFAATLVDPPTDQTDALEAAIAKRNLMQTVADPEANERAMRMVAEAEADASKTLLVGGESTIDAPVKGAPRVLAIGRQTMLGMPSSEVMAPPSYALARVSAPPPPAPPTHRTMLGVAVPGLAPSLLPAAGSGQSGGAPLHLPSRQGTMMGVAVPGIAPVHDGVPLHPLPQHSFTAQMPVFTPPIVPAPGPLREEPLPEAPRFVQKKGGIPALAVVVVVSVILAVAGAIGAFFLLRPSAPVVAKPQLDDTGKEFLAIQCATCPDGTKVALGASSTTIKNGAATLALPAPLAIGDNDILLKLDRPGAGRDEDVKLPLHVTYRVRADLSTLAAKPPAITVRVEVQPGSSVQVDGKPLAVDAKGFGSYAIDLSAETEGPSDEQRTFERKIPIVVASTSGKSEADQLTARTSIVPVHVDAPGSLLYTERTWAPITGQTRVNGTVAVDGQATPVDDKGHFATRLQLPELGEKRVEIVAGSAPLAPRSVHARVVRVASLEAQGKELASEGPLPYGAYAKDPMSKVGAKAVVEGQVVEVRSGAGYSSLLVDDKKSCAKGSSCLVRVLHGEETTIARGDIVRAYGKIVGIASPKQPIPDIEASLLLPVKATKK